jgi:hypothetical protein
LAKGKELGEFSLKSSSLTINPGPGGSTLIQGNFEGSATGFGVIIGTGTFVGVKSGSYDWCAVVYLENGEQVTGTGPGTYESVGIHRWRTQGVVQFPAGGGLITEGEIDLASRSWTGKMFENN